MSDDRRCETCAHWREPVGRWCVVLRHHTGPIDTCDHYEEAVPFADDAVGSDLDDDPLERYAAERGLSADKAAMQVVMADHELLDEIAKSGECMRDGKRLLMSDEVFETDGEEESDE